MVICQYNDELWMRHAIMLADRAELIGEIPVGAVIIFKDKIIGEGWNCSINLNDPTAHAEIVALRHAGKIINNYRILNSIMYVTLEPCVMCAGAILLSRISRLVFGANDKKNGAAGSVINTFDLSNNNHRVVITKEVLSCICSNQLNVFFRKRRIQNKINNLKIKK